jgi:ADP-L-glycero-D-manno-heptose 6-epimerase
VQIVTGGAGFIGSGVVHALSRRGGRVVVVDDLTDGTKFANLVGAPIWDYLDKDRFANMLESRDPWLDGAEAVLHEGACATTTEWNGRLMMASNFEYSKAVLAFCARRRVPLVYASSAAVYGRSSRFGEERTNEAPLNVYGYSKLLFDDYVRRSSGSHPAPVVGLRYFNVYGPRESHKGAMASVAFHLWRQLRQGGPLRLFSGIDGYADGEQRRDFVYVDDVVAANVWFLDHPGASGIFNVGTGRSQTFKELAEAIIRHFGRGSIEYIPFPRHLVGRYQSRTEADLARLRATGCDVSFRPVEEGVPQYMAWLESPSNEIHRDSPQSSA